jgi:ASC-1-like (ASCH) protein
MIHLLIPCYKRFVEEKESNAGDKSLAAYTFLYHVLPFFVETVLSSGIYFVQEYPNHPFSHVLLVCIVIICTCTYHFAVANILLSILMLKHLPGYEQFATRERTRLVSSVEENTNKYVQTLGENFSAVVASLQQEVRVVNDKIQEQVKKNDNDLGLVHKKLDELKEMIQSLQNTVPTVSTKLNNVDPGNNPQVNEGRTAATVLNLNAYQVMRNTPRVPAMSHIFPESWTLMFHEWETNKLDDFEKKGTKGKWENGLQQRYAKRFRAIKILKKLAGNNKSLKQMAADLEVSRIQLNSMSMTNHIEMLYKQYFAYKPRARMMK